MESVVTSSGRQVKPTRRAQESAERTQTNKSERKNKGKNPPQVKDKQARSDFVPAPRQPKTKPPRPSSDDKVPESAPASSKTTPAHTKHRPIRPSNLRLPPITPVSSTPKTTPRPDDSVKPKPSGREPAGAEKSDVLAGSDLARRSSSRLRIKLPPMNRGPAAGESATTPSDSNHTTTCASAPNQEHVTRRPERARPGGPRSHGGGRGRGDEEVAPAKTPEATSVNAANAQTMPPLGTGDAVPSAVGTSEDHLTINPTQSKSLAAPSSAGTHEAVDNTSAYSR